MLFSLLIHPLCSNFFPFRISTSPFSTVYDLAYLCLKIKISNTSPPPQRSNVLEILVHQRCAPPQCFATLPSNRVLHLPAHHINRHHPNLRYGNRSGMDSKALEDLAKAYVAVSRDPLIGNKNSRNAFLQKVADNLYSRDPDGIRGHNSIL